MEIYQYMNMSAIHYEKLTNIFHNCPPPDFLWGVLCSSAHRFVVVVVHAWRLDVNCLTLASFLHLTV